MLYAKKIAQGKGVVIPEDAKANSAAMSAWINSNRSASAASAVARPPTSRLDQLRLNRRRDKEVSETQSRRRCRSTGSRAAKFGHSYAATDSLWQQGGRSEAWRPLSLGWMVCPTRS